MISPNDQTAGPHSHLPRCVACLYAIGWGIKRIVRHTGYAKTSVHRFARWHSLITADSAIRKKANENTRRRAASRSWMIDAFTAEWRNAEAIDKTWARHPAITDYRSQAMHAYYADHEASKKRMRALALRRYYAAKRELIVPDWVIASRVRSRVANSIRSLTRGTARKAARTEELIGCSVSELRAWLEPLFLPGMSWANYGEWEIDHFMPCSSFDLRDPHQQSQCFSFRNLQPLWRTDNRRKWATPEGQRRCSTRGVIGSLLGVDTPAGSAKARPLAMKASNCENHAEADQWAI